MGIFRAFRPGRMDLILAWVLAGIFIPVVLIFVVTRAIADTALDQPVFLTLIFGPPVLMPFIAWRRRRRWWLWGLFGVVSGLLGVGQPLIQPVTVITVLLMGESSHRRCSSLPITAAPAMAIPAMRTPPKRPALRWSTSETSHFSLLPRASRQRRCGHSAPGAARTADTPPTAQGSSPRSPGVRYPRLGSAQDGEVSEWQTSMI